ncbi:alpha/beta hydrolase-fold protein [Streptomyces flavotricini]|uniref:alpha/beta hydrolase-fold protein n=1 Tax=Streptomyces flavotricini TaxID=66888 RepID=UPI001E31E967|nr:alpha/beta hydrolase-fold protein [Streptomyces flavotricini]
MTVGQGGCLGCRGCRGKQRVGQRGGSDHSGGGPPAWETYLIDELRPLLESGYRAGTVRAVAGLSMGGLGAMKRRAGLPVRHRGRRGRRGRAPARRVGAHGPLHRGVHARPYREREPVSSFPVLMAAVGA